MLTGTRAKSSGDRVDDSIADAALKSITDIELRGAVHHAFI
jgi:hypothetical protein